MNICWEFHWKHLDRLGGGRFLLTPHQKSETSDFFLNISRVIENPCVDPRRIKPNKHVETADLGLFKTRFSIIYRHRRVGVC